MAFHYTGFADEAGKTLQEQISTTKAAGWQSIELRLINGTNVCDLSDKDWSKTHETLTAAGITIAGFGSQIANWARPINGPFKTDLDELKRAIPRMRQANTNIIRIMSYPNVEGSPWPVQKWKAEVFRRLKELAKIARDNAVILGHENCHGYGGSGPDVTLEMLDAVNNSALKLIFDTGNNTLFDHDNEVTWKFYQGCKDSIVHVHIKAGKPGPNGTWIACYPDEDGVPRRILADLKQRGYEGWLSIEPHMAAAIHEGKDVTDTKKASGIYIEYAKRLEKLVAGL